MSFVSQSISCSASEMNKINQQASRGNSPGYKRPQIKNMFELQSENVILANAKPSINKTGSNDQRSSSGDTRRNKDKNNHFNKINNVPIGI